jgi:hypothetical protein
MEKIKYKESSQRNLFGMILKEKWRDTKNQLSTRRRQLSATNLLIF